MNIRELLLVHPIFHRGSGNTKKFVSGKEGITIDADTVHGAWVKYDGKHGGNATWFGIPATNIAAIVCEPDVAEAKLPDEAKRGPGRPPKAPAA